MRDFKDVSIKDVERFALANQPYLPNNFAILHSRSIAIRYELADSADDTIRTKVLDRASKLREKNETIFFKFLRKIFEKLTSFK